MSLPQAYQQLVSAFDALPGIGPQAAQRLAQHVLNQQAIPSLMQALQQAEAELQQCAGCRSYSTEPYCARCQKWQQEQSPSTLLVVETIGQWQQAQALGFDGLIFVLHGLLSPLAGRGPKQLGLDQLASLLTQQAVQKVTLALADSAEGKATGQFIQAISKLDIAFDCLSFEQWVVEQQ